MEQQKVSFIILFLFFIFSFSSYANNEKTGHLHHYNTKKNLDEWVSFEGNDTALSAVDALNVSNKKHGELQTNSLLIDWLKHNIDGPYPSESHTEMAIINEASVLFLTSISTGLPHHELFDIEGVRQLFFQSLRFELELLPLSTNIEESYLDRYYKYNVLKLAVYSVALDIALKMNGEQALIRTLSDISNSRQHPSIRQWLIAEFTNNQTLIESFLLKQLQLSASVWHPAYDEFSQALYRSHPYARVAAYAQERLIHQWPYMTLSKQAVMSNWYTQLQPLPNHKYGYSIVGEAISNYAREEVQTPHHSRWSSVSFVAISIGLLIIPELAIPEIVGELALGELAQELIFARSMFRGGTVADALYTQRAAELAAAESATIETPMTLQKALQNSELLDQDLLGEEIGPRLFHYLGTDAVEGIDYVAQVNQKLRRIRRFPSTEKYALFEELGSFGQYPIIQAEEASWVVKQLSESGNNWVNSGEFRHVLLLGKGKPESLFTHYANNVKSRYQIPASHLYSDGYITSRRLENIFPKMNNNQLADLTFDDRLDIVAHGNPYGPVSIGNIDIETSISPRGLVEQLKAQGLRQVGVLKLQSCNVGGGFYLPALSSELQRAGIDVGFISAPKGYLVQLPGLPRAVFDPFPTFSSDRYEIISTGLHQGFSGTRYINH
ncbi:hypothetical protein HQQ94_10385 [Shewanella sp. VB17]|uniref:hypothetical protein n=1 Tax=Shewanella sp. VB17 TaxID=2739432 RepID=UPI001563CC1B|nr:hypothetical protein [Shewanella sp. VB17]NRD73650.1 hypothetical protein [Shewanella sp. VB17]